MFATEGASEVMADYADAFGLEHTPEAVGAHFQANNHIPAGFVGNADDLAPMAAFSQSARVVFYRGPKYSHRWRTARPLF